LFECLQVAAGAVAVVGAHLLGELAGGIL